MRIAVVGSHQVGKTTLVEALADALPGHRFTDEPYALLEEEGHEFAHPPGVDDFVAQFERAVELLDEGEGQVVFDRCPLDFIGYLMALPETPDELVEELRETARRALRSLELLVFVPIETKASEPDALRERAHEALSSLVEEDWGVDVLVVSGSTTQRTRQILERLRARQ